MKKQREIYELRVLITNECNYKCEYCDLNFKDINIIDFDILVNNTIKLLNIFAKDKLIKLSFTGGEVFKYPSLLKYIKEIYIKFNNIELSFITNGTYINSIENIINFSNSNNIKLNIIYSYHGNDEKYNIKAFIDRISKVKHNYSIFFMLESNITEILKNYEYLKENNILNVEFLEVQGPNFKNIYNKYLTLFKNDAYFKENRFSTKVFKPNKKIVKCTAFIDNISLDYKGNIRPSRKCTDNRIFGNITDINIFDKLKKIKENGYYLCINPICNCEFNPSKLIKDPNEPNK